MDISEWFCQNALGNTTRFTACVERLSRELASRNCSSLARRASATRSFGDVAKIFVGVLSFIDDVARNFTGAQGLLISRAKLALQVFSFRKTLFDLSSLAVCAGDVVLARWMYLRRVRYLAKPVGLVSIVG